MLGWWFSICKTTFFLGNNNISTEGCKAITTALLTNKSLSLYNNLLGNEGCKAIATALLTNDTNDTNQS